jgi:hypothetical protein
MSRHEDISSHTVEGRTAVSVYLGDCTGQSLDVVCDGISILTGGSTWERAFDALAKPSPRGPYAISNRVTLFIFETLPGERANDGMSTTYRIDITCEASLAYATVQTAHSLTHLSPILCPIGDDAVTTARRVLQHACADGVTVASSGVRNG